MALDGVVGCVCVCVTWAFFHRLARGPKCSLSAPIGLSSIGSLNELSHTYFTSPFSSVRSKGFCTSPVARPSTVQ